MTRRLAIIAMLGALAATSGCATILGGGSSQAVSLESTPSQATYTLQSSSGIQMGQGQTPTTVSLPRKNEYQLTIQLDGYQTRTMALTKATNGWIWGNLVIGWIVGFIVDFATGSAYKLEPAFVSVSLDRAGNDVYAVVTLLDEGRSVIGVERLRMVPTTP